MNRYKKIVRLTEGDLHRIIKESVKKTLKESNEKIPAHKFLPELKKTYSKWQYYPNKPEGMDEAIDAIINAMHEVENEYL